MNIELIIKPRAINKAYLPYLQDERYLQIFFGGASSGKSYFIFGQRTPIDLMMGGRNFLIARNVAKYIRGSVFNEIVKGIQRYGLTKFFDIRKGDMVITCKLNGCQAVFIGLDDVEKVKSITPTVGNFTDLIVEEATETNIEDIKQLRRRLRGKWGRPKRITYLFNPIFKTHWLYESEFRGIWNDTKNIYSDEHKLILKTTYKDNEHLGREEIAELENEKDEYWHNVYTLGNWGVLGDLIFKNWKVEDLSEIKPTFAEFDNGLDFGYSNDPTALVRSHLRQDTIYITEEFWAKQMTNYDIAQNIKPIIKNDYVYCDPAEPKSIAELNEYGINALGAMKGIGSVNFGIQFLQGFNIIVDKQCQHTINEFGLYQWMKDKDGNTINKPVDKHNHFMDALRYANSYRYMQNKENAISVKNIGVFLNEY